MPQKQRNPSFWLIFQNFSNILKNGLNEPKTWISLLPGIHNSLPSFWAKLGYSHIKIDHIADSLLKLQIKIGVHLINVDLSQLLTVNNIKEQNYKMLSCFLLFWFDQQLWWWLNIRICPWSEWFQSRNCRGVVFVQ